jgi:beta-mannosidase
MTRAAYYAIARELRPYTVGMARKDIKKFDDETKGAFFTINQELQLWACNSTLQEKRAKIELVSFDLDGGEVDRQSFGGKLAPNASTEIWKGDVPGKPTCQRVRVIS